MLSVIVLAVPTIAMGGTLPAAARAVTRAGDTRRQDLATLYALNTLGAVAGCLVATFFLLEIYGTRATIWLAAALNILVAVVARAVDRGGRYVRPTYPPQPCALPDLPGLPAHPPFPPSPTCPTSPFFCSSRQAPSASRSS